MVVDAVQSPIEVDEAVHLAAIDPIYYSHEFFGKTCRQPSGIIQRKIWEVLEGPGRYANIQVFRGAAKTSTLRLFASRRVAYLLSRTILYVGKSEEQAIASLDWLRRQVLFNPKWSSTFSIRKGNTFQGTKAELYSESLQASIWLVAVGIEGSLRGFNLDDYRPDLIILDDVITEDNTGTPLARKQLQELILSAVKESLAAPGDCPNAKLVMLSTPQHKEDPACLAASDPEWTTLRLPCWTKETEDFPLDQRISAWPEMFPTDILIQEKKHHIARGTGHLFAREKELRLVDRDKQILRPSWLQKIDILPERSSFSEVVLTIDPVPKPTERQIANNLHNKDYEVMQVWGRKKEGFFLLDWKRNKGHDPSWTIAMFFELALRWRPRVYGVDATAYQSTLAWILSNAMKERSFYIACKEITDNRSKYSKIVDTLSGPGYEQKIFVPARYSDFITQWEDYPDVPYDDDLDAAQMAIQLFTPAALDDLEGNGAVDEEDEPSNLIRLFRAP